MRSPNKRKDEQLIGVVMTRFASYSVTLACSVGLLMALSIFTRAETNDLPKRDSENFEIRSDSDVIRTDAGPRRSQIPVDEEYPINSQIDYGISRVGHTVFDGVQRL